MAKFLITGGAGFIGTNFLNVMVDKYPNDFYVCFDALTYAGHKENIEHLLSRKNFKFIKGDITSREAVFNLFENEHFHYVINFAAETHVDRSLDNPEIFLRTNVIGTGVLMDACLKYGIKKFHQISTDEVYGDLPLEDTNEKFNENSPLKASSPYSASKASADLLVLAYHRTFKLPVTISRCTNNFGPYQDDEKLIPQIIKRIRKGEKVPLYGDGLNVRDWIYVLDHVEAVNLIVRSDKNGEIYNVGSNNEISNIEVARQVLDCFDKSLNEVVFVNDRPGHDLRYALNVSKIKDELGFLTTSDFNKSLKETIEWYKNRN